MCCCQGSRTAPHKQMDLLEKMSRKTLVTVLLIIVSALVAVALFVAGAIWRGRVTMRSGVTNSREFGLGS